MPTPAPETLWLDDSPRADGGPDGVARSLALDEALLEEAHEGVRAVRVVRTWMAARPVVVVGSSSRLAEEVDVEACGAGGVPIMRRPSGGATVILGPGGLMWTVVTPVPGDMPPVEHFHATLLEPLAAELSALGRPVVRAGTSDLVVGHGGDEEGTPRKVSGNALRVRRHGVLYHGTLLDDFDIALAARLLRHPPREPGYRRRRSHAAFLANLGLGRAALEAAVRRAFGATGRFPAAAIPGARVERLLRERYADRSWTERL